VTYNDLRAEWANIIEARIKTLAPNYNDWPDLPVVKIETLDVTSKPIDAYRYGHATGSLTTHKQVWTKQLPAEIRKLLPPLGDNGTIAVDFLAAPAAGQEDDLNTRNLLAVFASRDTYYPVRKTYPALFVTLGCEHDYDETGSRHQRGYHVGRCRKCGHRFVCDSGD
jgi:hypothetical protein